MRVGKLWVGRVAPLALSLALFGCKTWEPAGAAPERLIAESRPSSVRVTTADGLTVTLRNPLLVNDSLVSGVAPTPGAIVVPPRRGVAERDVNLIEVPRFSAGRTGALVGVIAGLSITWARVQGSGGGFEDRPGPLPKDPALNLVGIWNLLRVWF